MTKKTANADWSRKKILHALEEAGWATMRALAEHYGVSESTLNGALNKPYPASEERIAEAVKVNASQIWPSRYNTDGTPKRQGRPARRKVTGQKSTLTVNSGNVNITHSAAGRGGV